MVDKISVDYGGLRQAAASIESKKEELMGIYNNDIKTVIESSKQCIVTSGLNFDQVDASFKTTFTNLDQRLTELTRVLVEQIIPNYENLSDEIRRAFNNDFATQMSSLLDLGN